MGLYNLHVTGNPVRMAYQIHEEAYVMAPPFLWQRLPPEPRISSQNHSRFPRDLYRALSHQSALNFWFPE